MFRIKIAETVVEIDNRYLFVESQCRDYRTDAVPLFRVRVSGDEIAAYRATCGRPISEDVAESYLIYRHISSEMPHYGAFLLHASVVAMEGRGYAFSARRGVGKSTHTGLWTSHFGDRAVIVNGDKPLIRRAADGTFWAYGTPWCGKEGHQINGKIPLTALVFVERDERNHMEPSHDADTVSRLLEATILPSKKDNQDHMATLIGALVREVPAFTLYCLPNVEAAELSYEVLSQVCGKAENRRLP